jgi:CRP-like cAMP-binding protein
LALSPVYYQEIQQHRLFQHLPESSIKFILQNSGLISLKKNELLYECGFKAEHFFFVHRGQITLFQISSMGNEKIIDILEENQVFAETIMFSNSQRYPTNARATTQAELFYFNLDAFKQQMHQSNELCFSMMAEMSQRLNAQTQEIIELSIYDAQHRLVRYLLEKSCQGNYQSCQPVVVLSTTKSLLASRLSITPETFSRVLSRLKKQGLISIDDVTITLNEPQKLKDIVGECALTLDTPDTNVKNRWTVKKIPELSYGVG